MAEEEEWVPRGYFCALPPGSRTLPRASSHHGPSGHVREQPLPAPPAQ
eukprot:CAMPEP_0195608118 /NCGR_PEP_ID=MMETSP0815-20121206/8571_1 /TAXON_ID=97485 /ORGANISM="Prymnesium parvum, Strain Texoma1" /LENGTH=47 /DNA_ID= /DNA_START= /DNA_END= /DNA_ORIENTATION=